MNGRILDNGVMGYRLTHWLGNWFVMHGKKTIAMCTERDYADLIYQLLNAAQAGRSEATQPERREG